MGAVIWKLVDYPDEEPKTCEGWATKLNVPFLRYDNSMVRRQLEGPDGLWEETHARLCEQRKALQQLLADAEVEVSSARDALAAAVTAAGASPLGGELVLVDLAGADYDHRAGAAQKESAAINKSLLALKECFRSLAATGPQSGRAKFRDSKLTRMLEDALVPTANSSRRNVASASVMLVNISPAADLQKATLNALRYGQLYATPPRGRERGRGGTGSSSRRGGSSSQQSTARTQAVVAALRAIYSEHAPDKTAEEVEEIIAKFAGREQTLLRKVRAKYVEDDAQPAPE